MILYTVKTYLILFRNCIQLHKTFSVSFNRAKLIICHGVKLRNCKVYGAEVRACNFWAQLSDTVDYVIMNMKYSALSFPPNNIRSTMTQLCCIVFPIFFCCS